MYLKSHDKAECCGCRACAEACPKNCIKMVEDEESFVYPTIDMFQCIRCHKCEAVCPMSKPPVNSIKVARIGIHKNSEVAFKSASGGAFSAIAKLLLERGYTVFGVKYGENFEVQHDSATTIKEFAAFRKSKYVLSNTNGSFSTVKMLLNQNKKVVFSGTPCQIAALKSFLNTENENLICIDIICHGAPSQRVFNEELRYLENQYHSRVICYEFRNKRKISQKINSRTAYVKLLSGAELLLTPEDDPYLKGYYSRLFYRPSCGKCPFAVPMRNSDITLADAWGIDKVYPDMNALSGVSMILANTDVGQKIISGIAGSLNIRIIDIDWAVKSNEQLHKPTDFHPRRDLFFKLWREKSYLYAVNKCTEPPFKIIVKRSIAKILPQKLKVKIKDLLNKWR